MLKDLARWVRRSTKERANGKQSSPRREDYSPGRRKGLHRLAQIRTFAISQREEFSLFTSKFESDMPSHGVGLCSGIVEAPHEALDAGKALDAPYHCARTDAGGALGRDALPARPRWPAAPGSSTQPSHSVAQSVRTTTGHGTRRAGHQSFPLMRQVQPRSRGRHEA